MEEYALLFLALFVVGIALAATAFLKKSPLKGVNPVIAVVVGVCLVIPGYFYGVQPYFATDDAAGGETTGTIVVTTPDEEVTYPTFDIQPSAANTTQPAVLSSGEDGFTLPFIANTTQHDIYKEDNTSWCDPEVQFCITPIPFAGATQDDLATIYFEVVEPDLEVDAASSGPYYLFVKTGGKRQLEWHSVNGAVGANIFISGSDTMLMTGNQSMQLLMECDEGSLSRMQTEYDAITVHIKFSNGGGWSETFWLDFIPIKIAAASTPDVW
jgi:hypothetical protein